jgi:hypothetical protein
VRFGEPIDPAAFRSLPEHAREAALTAAIMERIAELVGAPPG